VVERVAVLAVEACVLDAVVLGELDGDVDVEVAWAELDAAG
jgi:hypothetical protein